MFFFFFFNEENSEIKGSKNKGDWSEFYALLYLIGKRVLYCADKNLNKLPDYFFPINKVIRTESSDKSVHYVLNNTNQVQIWIGEDLVRTMTSDEFAEEANYLYEHLINETGQPIDIPRSRAFLNNIQLDRLGMPNSEVSDLKLDLHDTHTGIDQIMGFSIKSYIGGAPTLLNASKSTNFVYAITGLDDSSIDYINSINTKNKIQKRMELIHRLGGELCYSHMQSQNFRDNLIMIDSNMERIVSEVVLDSYRNSIYRCSDLIDNIEHKNPLRYNRNGIYEYKFKQLLIAKALGMNPDSVWDGLDNANGGYIVVKENGDVLAYHLYNRNDLEQYLFDNTMLERASTSRHDFATIYRVDDKYYINLNLQIRFI